MEEEKKSDPNEWALAYGDMITLLMTFFILIIAMSTIKMEDIVDGINNNDGLGDNLISASLKETGLLDEKIASQAKLMIDYNEPPPPVDGTDYVREAMVVFVSENELTRIIDLEKAKEGFMIRIRADILFDKGVAKLRKEYLYLLDNIAELLSMVPNDVRIDGHTDDRYTENDYTDNKLSIVRATNVCRYFVEEWMLTPARFGIAGYGRYRPLLPNISEENRARNRRVEIVIKEIPQDV